MHPTSFYRGYPTFVYCDGNGVNIEDRADAVAAACAWANDTGGIVLDDSRAILVRAGDDLNEIVRVAGDGINRLTALRLSDESGIWYDSEKNVTRVMNRDLLLDAAAKMD